MTILVVGTHVVYEFENDFQNSYHYDYCFEAEFDYGV